MYKRYLFALVLFCSCKKTVKLPLNTTTSQIVIQGEVSNVQGPYTVTINKSVGFYDDNTFPPVSGATVIIAGSAGDHDSLTEIGYNTGIYQTHSLLGRPGETYNLIVVVGQQVYTASSTMPYRIVPLDSISFVLSGRRLDQYNAVANFQDPAGVKNYYQFLLFINGALFNRDIFVFDDRLSDGRYITQTLAMDSAYLQPGYLLQVVMNGIDSNVYNYFYQLQQSSGGGAFNTAASPTNPVSNISNGAFGYFSAHTSFTRQTIVY
jgi:hypothetical protein